MILTYMNDQILLKIFDFRRFVGQLFFPETRDVQDVNFLFELQADMNLRASVNSPSDYIYY